MNENNIEDLDTFNLKLNQISLIEASAGTGKTYTITNLFLRLLLNIGNNNLEEKILYDQILVVTFTIAASQELKERIEKRIKDFIHILNSTHNKVKKINFNVDENILNNIYDRNNIKDIFFTKLLNHIFLYKQENILEYKNILFNTFQNIDRLAIFTIDSFCSKILNTFVTSHNKQGYQIISDNSDYLKQAINYVINDKFLNLNIQEEYSIPLFNDLFSVYVPEIEIDNNIFNDGKYKSSSIDRLLSNFNKLFDSIDIEQLIKKYDLYKIKVPIDLINRQIYSPNYYVYKAFKILKDKIISKNKFYSLIDLINEIYFDNNQIVNILKVIEYSDKLKNKGKTLTKKELKYRLDNLIVDSKEIYNPINLFSRSFINEIKTIYKEYKYKQIDIHIINKYLSNTKKSLDDTEFTILNYFIEIYNSFKIDNYKEVYIRYYREWYVYLASMVFRRFNYLMDLNKVIDFNENKATLLNSLKNNISNIREKIIKLYPFALIDEFQDTSKNQLDIFKLIYIDYINNCTNIRKHGFIMIGDPKQAIYSFRNADINNYFFARQLSDKQYSLNSNYRSSSNFINTINMMFSNKNSFAINEIKYNYSDIGNTNIPELTLDNEAISPVTFINSEIIKNVENDTKSNKLLVNIVTNMIKLGSEGRLKIGNKNVQAGDIAIISFKNKELNIIKKLLAEKNINAKFSKSINVKESTVYKSMCLLIDAIINNDNRKKVIKYLSSILSLYSSEEVINIINDENKYLKEVILLQELLNIWNKYGFQTFIKEFIIRTNFYVKSKLYTNGKQWITDLLHITEWIQSKLHKNNNNEDIITMLNSNSIYSLEDEKYLDSRISSLNDQVILSTIHSSKGLEFPIVINTDMAIQNSNATYDKIKENHHILDIKNHLNNKSITVDLCSIVDNNTYIDVQKSEWQRLAYVTLTRPKYCCIFITKKSFFTNISKEDRKWTSLLNFIPNHMLPNYNNDVICINNNFKFNLELIIENNIVNESNDLNTENTHFSQLDLDVNTKSYWSINSFSSLTRNTKNLLLDDKHQDNAAETLTSNNNNIKLQLPNNIPSGATFGTAIHEIFEKISFQVDNNNFKLIHSNFKFQIKSILNYNLNIDDNLIHEYEKFIINILNYKFNIGNRNLSLSEVTDNQRYTEWNFDLSIKNHITFNNFNNILKKHNWLNQFITNIENVPLIKFKELHGMLTGFVDLIININNDNKYLIIDYKSNNLGQDASNYDISNLNKTIIKNRYDIQILIYTIAVYSFLKKNKDDFDYDKDFIGVAYLFIRGMSNPIMSNNQGILFIKPSIDLVKDLYKYFNTNKS